MKIEKGKLIIHKVDLDHIIGWFEDELSLKEAIEVELHLAGLEKWEFDTNKIYLEKGEGSDNKTDKINESLKHHENLLKKFTEFKGGIYDTT